MTCANVTRFELFFDRDRSRTWNQNVPLGPFFGPPFERNCTSIFSFELRNWIKNGPDGRKTDGRRKTEDGRTDTHDFLGPPLHNKPFGQKTSDLATFLWGGEGEGQPKPKEGKEGCEENKFQTLSKYFQKYVKSRHGQN